MTSCRVTSWSILRFQATIGSIDFAADNQGAFSCITHARLRCVYSSSIKQCLRSVKHEQIPMQMTQNNKHNKWLEMLACKDFPPNSSGERRLKFIASGEDDDNKKPRSRETIGSLR